MKRVYITLLLAAFAFGSTPLAAQTNLTSVSLGVTSKTANEWAEYVADQLGFFAANGIKVDFIYTGSAAAGAQQLTAGALDISEVSSTQMGEAIQGGAPITMIVEHGTKAPYLLLGKKGVTSLAALKGKTIIVGGPNDITRVFMDKVLASAKLKPDDYSYTYAGATTERFAALASGGVEAAILFPPFSYRAAAMGYPVLADISNFFPTFLFDGFAVKPDWAKAHSDLVIRFIKGYLQGVRWLDDPANKARAIQILSATTNTSPEDSQQTYDLFVSKLHDFSRTGLTSNASLGPVLDALVKIGQLTPPVPPASKFFDNTYAAAANAQLRGR
jgi:NitT/TauT family transport system substrate-binding protein